MNEQYEKQRAAIVDDIPKGYSPLLHFITTHSICIVMIAVSINFSNIMSGLAFLAIPAAIIVANGFEHWFHKYIMHHNLWEVLESVYIKHRRKHHVFFRWTNMGTRNLREHYHIFMPVRTIVLFVFVAHFFALIAWLIGGRDAGLLFLATEAVYVSIYECTHTIHHLPAERRKAWQWIPILGSMMRHHARHHETSWQHKYNFNIFLPLTDFLFRTLVPRAKLEERRRRYADKGVTAL